MKKICERTKNFIKDNYKTFIFYIVLIFLVTYKLPYYIYTGGGVLDTNDKVSIKDEYKTDGKFKFAYVESRNATIPMFLIAKINDKWDIEKISDYKIDEEDTYKDLIFRDKLDLQKSIESATLNAYRLAGYDIKINKITNYVIYIKDKRKTNLEVGDIITKVNDIDVSSVNEVREIIKNMNVGDKVIITTLRNNKEIVKHATVFENDGEKVIGIGIESISDFNLDKEVEFKFKNNESGPSGGMMLALTIYNKLTSDDITNGLNIVGTGTIEEDGTIGEIGGVKYKLSGAVKNKADLFIVANGNNYKEAIKLKKKYKYKIKIIGVDSLSDAISKLKNKNY